VVYRHSLFIIWYGLSITSDCIYLQGLTVLGSECITRSVQLSRDDMITFISYDNPFFDRLSDEARNEMKKFGR